MPVEWTVLISSAAGIVGMVGAVMAMQRNTRHDREKQSTALHDLKSEQAIINTKIDHITVLIAGLNGFNERLVIAEQSSKQALKRIEELAAIVVSLQRS